ncbi:TlpA family protein disulfide reductase [Roseibium litorale]|uniref:TlpA family protein disulfide reductase n=1 Tax=Roseibium litorale TaxID=2803841 RepID=A0ABR9CUG2_9HYPH|nr:TlpA disulfide reductase family protein [Roseibium litorale]MBD8893907.1 TlpA family protein disulfide reductase [Roseibium litorale]
MPAPAFTSRRQDLSKRQLLCALAAILLGVSSVARAEERGLRLTNETGQTLSLKELTKDKPVLVHLWASWCAPCREELPELAAFKAALPEDLQKRFLVVSVDTKPLTAVQSFLSEDLDLPGLDTLQTAPAEAGRTFRIKGYPSTVFLNADGKIVRRIDGSAPWGDSAFQSDVIRHLTE